MSDKAEGPANSRPHLRIDGLKQPVRFKGHQAKILDKFKRDDRDRHGRMLLDQLAAALRVADADRRELGLAEHLGSAGVFVSVERPSSLPEEKLQQKREGILAAAITPAPQRSRGAPSERVAYFVPDDKRAMLEAQIAEYRDSQGQNKPNAVHKRFDEVDAILFAGIASLWTSPGPLPEDDQEAWFELWLRRKENSKSPDADNWLTKRAAPLGYRLSDELLRFPEIIVRFIHAKGRTLKRLVLELGSQIAEVRAASIDASVFTTIPHDGGERVRPTDWVTNAAPRIVPPPRDCPYVTLHDTGVAHGHPLLSPVIDAGDVHARVSDWLGADHHGHGTTMAGIAAFGDLQFHLQGAGPMTPSHRLESYKILPPVGENPPNSYGLVVHDAVSDLEIAGSARERVHCCTVTAQACEQGHPSTWSSAVDQVTAGVPNDDLGERGPKRLWVQAVGNILPFEWEANEDHLDHPVQEPAQSWNALSVGGFTDRPSATEADFSHLPAFAAVGDRSPYSRTSLSWERSMTPQKPEVVFEAGNWLLDDPSGYLNGFDSLSMLTTGRHFDHTPLVSTDMTSPATAQAARFAAEIMAANPGIWPEAVRALMIHSAEWTPAMERRLANAGNMEGRAALLRQFGYGVPRLSRALTSTSNMLALMATSPIQPFRQVTVTDPKTGKSTKSIALNEAHYYPLPWPDDLLRDYYAHEFQLKLTLSWFIEPNPGALGSRYPKSYRSYGLKLDLQRQGEDFDDFKARINANEPQGGGGTVPDDTNWILGSKRPRAGSLIADVWSGTVAGLLARRHVCVSPRDGWWKSRTRAKRFNDEGRYCLIASLSAPSLPVDIHAALQQEIDARIAAMTVVDIFS
ncbi:S8 family peptidase [Xanthobacter agilis]|uniref:S8 family peptidase n=1 Tax=Xanthobacter agilis TaxID=47492 RepID=UPI00372BAF24